MHTNHRNKLTLDIDNYKVKLQAFAKANTCLTKPLHLNTVASCKGIGAASEQLRERTAVYSLYI